MCDALTSRTHTSETFLADLVTPIGFEPITCPLGGGCSIQLSHGAVHVWIAHSGGLIQWAKGTLNRTLVIYLRSMAGYR